MDVVVGEQNDTIPFVEQPGSGKAAPAAADEDMIPFGSVQRFPQVGGVATVDDRLFARRCN